MSKSVFSRSYTLLIVWLVIEFQFGKHLLLEFTIYTPSFLSAPTDDIGRLKAILISHLYKG